MLHADVVKRFMTGVQVDEQRMHGKEMYAQ